ncbi:MAG: DUF1330 domain-containing protein [Pseudomonadales bacterium]|jgi:uncharacterized protein (DUF1330 family)
MNVSNAVTPTQEQLQSLLDSDFEGPVSMLNLLKFKEHAEYADGRTSELSGAEAYSLYGEKMAPFVISKGGRLIFGGRAEHLMLGEVDELWDTVAIMEYPSKEAFVEIVSAPEVGEFSVHRSAGLAGQLLIAVSAQARI